MKENSYAFISIIWCKTFYFREQNERTKKKKMNESAKKFFLKKCPFHARTHTQDYGANTKPKN